MASNESAFGAGRGVGEAVARAAGRVHRYPDPLATEVRLRLAERLDVAPDQLLIGNGSDELILLVALAYASGGGSVVCADPPYRLHEVIPRTVGSVVHRVPLHEWTHDLASMARVDADVAFICNPHNPTGTVVPVSAIAEFAGAGKARMVVVDEAYVDFAEDQTEISAIDLARRGDVVVTRTFSKVHGLAGARAGYLVAAPEVVDILRRVRSPFSVNAFAQAAAVAALDDPEHAAGVRAHTQKTRERLNLLFRGAGYRTVPSQANFVLVLTPDEDQLVERLDAHGIRVRPGRTLDLPGSVRVTVPSNEGLALLERALLEGDA